MKKHSLKNYDGGVALLLVLGAVTLISIVITGFLMTVRQDRTTAGFYEGGSSARQYAETAVNIAIAQVADATAEPDLGWISQPGMLRTFDDKGPVAAYKLYSSDRMKVTGEYDPQAQESNEVPTNWKTRPNEFVDLNRPVQTSTGNLYPVVDPEASKPATAVEGFSYVDATRVATPDNILPMPVRWIYVHKDGSLLDYATAATREGIVARIAFWGDDETAKVNLNTASESVFYDAPSSATREEMRYGLNQPVSQEYQRYPGHPSSTSLSAVFKPLRDIADPGARSQKAAELFPRIGWGGSEGGTKAAWWKQNMVRLDSDRLFASVDEVLYGRDPSGSWLDSDGKRVVNKDSGAQPKEFTSEKLRFFLTTSSRAPELNLLHRPRITLWPFNKELVDTDNQTSPKLTPEDRLIRFASEIGSNHRKLYFQRENAWDPRHDFTAIPENQDLYAYLQSMTGLKMPSGKPQNRAGDTIQNKYGALGRDQILTEMFDYLRCLVNTSNQSYKPVGGPVYSFPQGYETTDFGSRDLCPIIIDAGNGVTKGATGPLMQELVLQFYCLGEEPDATNAAFVIRKVQMVALMDCGVAVNHLFGLNPRIQIEVSGPSWQIQQPSPMLAGQAPIQMRPVGGTWSAGTTAVGLNFPSSGGDSTLACWVPSGWDDSRSDGGSFGVQWPVFRAGSSAIKQDGTIGVQDGSSKGKLFARGHVGWDKYPFFSDVIELRIPAAAPTTPPGPPKAAFEPVLLAFGNTVTSMTVDVKFYAGLTTPASDLTSTRPRINANLLLKMPLSLTPFRFPAPKVAAEKAAEPSWTWVEGGSLASYKYSDFKDYSKRLKVAYRTYILGVPRKDSGGPSDTFRSFRLKADANAFGGDYRMAAVRTEIPSSWWEPHPGNDIPTLYHATNVFVPNQTGWRYWENAAEEYYLTAGKHKTNYSELMRERGSVISNVLGSNRSGRYRYTAPGMNGALRKTSGGSSLTEEGDFTLGYGSLSEGAYVVGPDLGSVAYTRSSSDASVPSDVPYFFPRISRTSSSDTVDAGSMQGYKTNFTGLLYTPAKQVPSPVLFGTLPSRALEGTPGAWETLLFCPNPAGGKSTHRGWTQQPKDHYWLDLFYMPVVEPYAITENFATAGKINLNSQIAPFTYIKRQTGLHALMRNLMVRGANLKTGSGSGNLSNDLALMKPTDVLDDYASDFKSQNIPPASASENRFNQPVNISETLSQWDQRFAANDPFVSPSEICELFLVPKDGTLNSVENYYKNTAKLTGDEKREMPYNHLYPRVTTKSNTFKIHFVAQSLKGVRGSGGNWQVNGEYRGSQIIERYVSGYSGTNAKFSYGTGSSPSAAFPALAGNAPAGAGGAPYYRFRKLSHQQFAP